jgi:hypothetical protein
MFTSNYKPKHIIFSCFLLKSALVTRCRAPIFLRRIVNVTFLIVIEKETNYLNAVKQRTKNLFICSLICLYPIFSKITHFAFAIGSLIPCFTKKKEKKRTKFFLCEYHIVLDLAFNRIIVRSRGKTCEGNESD